MVEEVILVERGQLVTLVKVVRWVKKEQQVTGDKMDQPVRMVSRALEVKLAPKAQLEKPVLKVSVEKRENRV
jgi:hypothetical protein